MAETSQAVASQQEEERLLSSLLGVPCSLLAVLKVLQREREEIYSAGFSSIDECKEEVSYFADRYEQAAKERDDAHKMLKAARVEVSLLKTSRAEFVARGEFKRESLEGKIADLRIRVIDLETALGVTRLRMNVVQQTNQQAMQQAMQQTKRVRTLDDVMDDDDTTKKIKTEA
jgi:hypothetical protein